MTGLVSVEIICAILIAVLIIGQFREADTKKSAVWLRINSVVVFCWLIIDASAYLTGLKYFPTLLAYSMGNIALFSFLGYFNAYIGERTKLNP